MTEAVNWVHWTERPKTGERRIPYHASKSFLKNIGDDDTFSLKAVFYFGLEDRPGVLEFYTEDLLAEHDGTITFSSLDAREQILLCEKAGLPPPNSTIPNTDTDHCPVDPVYLGDRNSNDVANSLNWEWYFVYQDDSGNRWLFKQNDANRYWVAGAGNWSDNTNHWAAASGGAPGASKPANGDNTIVDNNSDSGVAFQITLDENTANIAQMNVNCTDATCTVSCGANNWTSTQGFQQVNGVLDCGSGTHSFTGTSTTFNYSIYVGGTFTGGNATTTIGSIVMIAGSTVTLSSGTTTINSIRNGSAACMAFLEVVTFDDGNGTLNFTYAGTQVILSDASTAKTFYNLNVTKGAGNVLQFGNTQGFNLTCDNNLTIASGTFDTEEQTSGVDKDLAVTGVTSITGILDGNGSSITSGAIVINVGGTYSATTATTELGDIESGGYNFRNQGTLTHNNGRIYLNGGGGYPGGSTSLDFGGDSVYDLELNSSGDSAAPQSSTTVANDLTVTAGIFRFSNVAHTLDVTGTASVTGQLGGVIAWSAAVSFGALTINAAGNYVATSGTTTTGTITMAHGATLTMSDGSGIAGSGAATAWTSPGIPNITWNNCSLSDLDLQINETSGNTGITITLTGDMGFDTFTIQDNDTITCTTAGTTVTVGNTHDFIISGTANITGGSGNNIVWTGQRSFQMSNISATQTLSFLTLTGINATTAWNNGPDITVFDGAVIQTRNITLTNGLVGLQGGVSETLLVAKDYADTSGDWRYWGYNVNTNAPDAGYRAMDWTSATTLYLLNADVYQASVTTEITMNETGAWQPLAINVDSNGQTIFNIQATFREASTAGPCRVQCKVTGDIPRGMFINAGGADIGLERER